MSRPIYNAKQYCVFDEADKTKAENALSEINSPTWFPLVGRNAGTGELVAGAETLRWAELEQRNDGKWIFPRVPDEVMNKFNVPESTRDEWWNKYQPLIEEFSESWRKVD